MNVLKCFIKKSHLEEKSDVVQHKRCINILRETPVVGDPLKKNCIICSRAVYPLWIALSVLCALCCALSVLPLWIALSFSYALLGQTPILKRYKI